jgi:THAP4-like, heme-binding beta-barrel domain
MINLPTDVPSELVPLSWLIGVWEGTGVVEYSIGERPIRQEFGQRISFSHDGLPYLNYSSHTWMPEDGDSADPLGGAPLVAETGYWRLAREFLEGDPGPGMLPSVGPRPYSTAESVETLRNEADGFDLQVSLVHPTGVNELYLGQVRSGRIDLATDAVMRTEGAKEYSAATRIYGLVEGDLLWAWDIAALGQRLRSHASGRLSRVD